MGRCHTQSDIMQLRAKKRQSRREKSSDQSAIIILAGMDTVGSYQVSFKWMEANVGKRV